MPGPDNRNPPIAVRALIVDHRFTRWYLAPDYTKARTKITMIKKSEYAHAYRVVVSVIDYASDFEHDILSQKGISA